MKNYRNVSMTCNEGFGWYDGAEIPPVTSINRGMEVFPILPEPPVETCETLMLRVLSEPMVPQQPKKHVLFHMIPRD